MAAARVLVVLGRVEALKVLLESAARDPAMIGEAGPVLPWLVWKERLAAFQRLIELSEENNDRLEQVVSSMAEVNDLRPRHSTGNCSVARAYPKISWAAGRRPELGILGRVHHVGQ